MLVISDYHLLDAPPHIHNFSTGQPALGDATLRRTEESFEKFTSLNHSVQFVRHEAFRADEISYIEVKSPWTGGRRGGVESRIYGEEGGLVAVCLQEAYFVLKEGGGARKGKL